MSIHQRQINIFQHHVHIIITDNCRNKAGNSQRRSWHRRAELPAIIVRPIAIHAKSCTVEGALCQRLYLREVGDVGLHVVFVADAEFVGELLQAVEAARAEDDVRAVFDEVAPVIGLSDGHGRISRLLPIQRIFPSIPQVIEKQCDADQYQRAEQGRCPQKIPTRRAEHHNQRIGTGGRMWHA